MNAAAAPAAADQPARPAPSQLPLGAGLLLLAATGSVDTYLYLAHGHVFAEAMTGNLVLIGVGAFSPALVPFWRPLTAYVAFVVGVALAWRLGRTPPGTSPPAAPGSATAQYVTLATEIALLVTVAFVPASFPNAVVVAALAFAAGMQIASFNHVGPAKFTTVVMTSNTLTTTETTLRSLAGRARQDRTVAARLLTALASFIGGVFLGGFVTTQFGHRASLVAAALYLAAGAWYATDRRSAPRVRAPSAAR